MAKITDFAARFALDPDRACAMSGVNEISEDLTNYGISCHPETGSFGEFPISLWRFWF